MRSYHAHIHTADTKGSRSRHRIHRLGTHVCVCVCVTVSVRVFVYMCGRMCPHMAHHMTPPPTCVRLVYVSVRPTRTQSQATRLNPMGAQCRALHKDPSMPDPFACVLSRSAHAWPRPAFLSSPQGNLACPDLSLHAVCSAACDRTLPS